MVRGSPAGPAGMEGAGGGEALSGVMPRARCGECRSQQTIR